MLISFFEQSYALDSTKVENIFNIAVAKLREKKDEDAYVKFVEFMKITENRNDYEKQRIEAKEQIDFLKEDLTKRKRKIPEIP